jgi:ribosomal protein S18 acetylase RimI-like enzyme
MSTVSTRLTSVPKLHVRRLARRDLPHVLQLAEQLAAPVTLSPQFRLLVQSKEILGCIAEAHNQIAGYAICAIVRESKYAGNAVLKFAFQLGQRLVHKWVSRPLQVDLLHVAVATEWQDCGVEHQLLQELDRQLRQAGSCLKMTVPETNLPVQLFLHDAGYKATQVLRGYYTSEDGYLFEYPSCHR